MNIKAIYSRAKRMDHTAREELCEDLLHQGHNKVPKLPLSLRQLPQFHKLHHLGPHIRSLSQCLDQLVTT